MQVALRNHGVYGGWRRRGMGDAGEDFWDSLFGSGSGETTFEGGGLPTAGAGLDNSSGEVLYYITGAPTAPGPTLSPEEFAAEQADAYAWIKANTTPVNATQLAQAIASGAIAVSALTSSGARVCPSGYQFPNGQCVQTAAPSSGGGLLGGPEWISGVSNKTVALAVGGLLVLSMFMGGGGGGRRR